MLYLALHAVTGERRRQSLTLSDIEPLASDEVLYTLAGLTEQPNEWVTPYNVALKDFIAPSALPISRTLLSKREFRNRLGAPVRLAILALRRSTDPAKAGIRDRLEDMKETLDSVAGVDLENPDTLAGVNGLAQLGLLTASDVTRILAPSTVEAE